MVGMHVESGKNLRAGLRVEERAGLVDTQLRMLIDTSILRGKS